MLFRTRQTSQIFWSFLDNFSRRFALKKFVSKITEKPGQNLKIISAGLEERLQSLFVIELCILYIFFGPSEKYSDRVEKNYHQPAKFIARIFTESSNKYSGRTESQTTVAS